MWCTQNTNPLSNIFIVWCSAATAADDDFFLHFWKEEKENRKQLSAHACNTISTQIDEQFWDILYAKFWVSLTFK